MPNKNRKDSQHIFEKDFLEINDNRKNLLSILQNDLK
jgi:hypothetical protein